ncbi:MAG: hypothetical protein WKG03_18420 [Telluria sp.]
MKTMTGNGATTHQRTVAQDLARVVIGTALVLMIPLVAMQFDSGVDWSVGDFVIIAVLLGSTGLMYVTVARKLSSPRQRALVGAGLLLFVLLCWAELAVGVFGSPFAGS